MRFIVWQHLVFVYLFFVNWQPQSSFTFLIWRCGKNVLQKFTVEYMSLKVIGVWGWVKIKIKKKTFVFVWTWGNLLLLTSRFQRPFGSSNVQKSWKLMPRAQDWQLRNRAGILPVMSGSSNAKTQIQQQFLRVILPVCSTRPLPLHNKITVQKNNISRNIIKLTS